MDEYSGVEVGQRLGLCQNPGILSRDTPTKELTIKGDLQLIIPVEGLSFVNRNRR